MTLPPLGYQRIAWSRNYRVRTWSLVHLETTDMNGALCGARPGVHSSLAVDHELDEHERRIGKCSRCWLLAEKTMVPAGDVGVGDVVEGARGPREVTGISFQSETRIELAYGDGGYGVYNVERKLRVRSGGER